MVVGVKFLLVHLNVLGEELLIGKSLAANCACHLRQTDFHFGHFLDLIGIIVVLVIAGLMAVNLIAAFQLRARCRNRLAIASRNVILEHLTVKENFLAEYALGWLGDLWMLLIAVNLKYPKKISK